MIENRSKKTKYVCILCACVFTYLIYSINISYMNCEMFLVLTRSSVLCIYTFYDILIHTFSLSVFGHQS